MQSVFSSLNFIRYFGFSLPSNKISTSHNQSFEPYLDTLTEEPKTPSQTKRSRVEEYPLQLDSLDAFSESPFKRLRSTPSSQSTVRAFSIPIEQDFLDDSDYDSSPDSILKKHKPFFKDSLYDSGNGSDTDSESDSDESVLELESVKKLILNDPVKVRGSKETAKKTISKWCKQLLDDRFRRPTVVITKIEDYKTEIKKGSRYSTFTILNSQAPSAFRETKWVKVEYTPEPGRSFQQHTVNGIYVYSQSSYDYEKHVPATHKDSVLTKAKEQYVKDSALAPSVSRLNRAHLVQRMLAQIPLHSDTAVPSSPYYNQVVMREQELKLNRWIDLHGIKHLNAKIEVTLLDSDLDSYPFQKFVRQVYKKYPEHNTYITETISAYIKSLNIPVIESCHMIFTVDPNDPVYSDLPVSERQFIIYLGSDLNFSFRRNFTGETPVHRRFKNLGTPSSQDVLTGLSMKSPSSPISSSKKEVIDYSLPGPSFSLTSSD